MAGFEAAQDRVFDAFDIEPRQRFVALDQPPVRIHVSEIGDGSTDEVPLFFVHGLGFFGATFAPLMAELDDTRMIAIDRPGYGLSGDFSYTGLRNHRQTIVDVLEGILDELGIEQADIVGHSAGGHWSVVFALARPERVRRQVLIGAPQAFPGTDLPLQFRLLVVPVLKRLFVWLQDSSEEGIVDQMEMFGEAEMIQEYPSLIKAIAAQQQTPRAHDVTLSEIQGTQTLRGRGHSASIRLGEDEVMEMQQPTLVIWGDHEPVGGREAVRDVVERIPEGRFETVDGGHFPWLGRPEACADLILELRD